MFVRKDISKEDQSVQVAHAARRSQELFGGTKGTYLVVCGVKDLFELLQVIDLCDDNDIKHCCVFEPDIKEKEKPMFTALATEIVKPELRTVFKNYKLLRFK